MTLKLKISNFQRVKWTLNISSMAETIQPLHTLKALNNNNSIGIQLKDLLINLKNLIQTGILTTNLRVYFLSKFSKTPSNKLIKQVNIRDLAKLHHTLFLKAPKAYKIKIKIELSLNCKIKTKEPRISTSKTNSSNNKISSPILKINSKKRHYHNHNNNIKMLKISLSKVNFSQTANSNQDQQQLQIYLIPKFNLNH